MTTPTEVIERQLAAYNARDIDAFVAMYSPTITIARHADGQVTVSGLAALRKAYGDVFATSPNLHCAIVNRMVIGNYVIDHEHVTGRGAGPALNVIVIYEVQDELIQRTWVVRE